ncbi:MAG TPA: septal ring lytic transglycosylase RlpA family protein [Stellaceae bacterium]|nr:septal ring lytic transglycosylase RlpA family protein [Stellaceae bacterium]
MVEAKPATQTSIALAEFHETGIASWYGEYHQGRPTASGVPFDMNRLTAAHRSLPLNSRVRVTNLENGRSVVVKINDRGPYVEGRSIDLSAKAAEMLGMKSKGLAEVDIDLVADALD